MQTIKLSQAAGTLRALVVRLAWLGAAILLALPIAMAPARAQEVKSDKRTVTVTASGQVNAAPDAVIITTGVLSEAETAKAALAANNESMSRVINTLKAAGLAARDIQTSDFSVQPKLEYFQDNRPPKLTGYQVSNQVVIRVSDVTKIGDVLDRVVESGSNQISGIQFIVTNADKLQDEARKVAFEAAKRKAELYASAAGTSLDDVLSVTETATSSGPRPMMQKARLEQDNTAPIEAGEQTLEVQVTVVWQLD